MTFKDKMGGDKSGFTLLEVMIASTLLLLAGLSLYSSMISAGRMAAICKDYSAAQAISFDSLWEKYNRPISEFEDITVATNWSFAPPEFNQLADDAIVRMAIFPPTEDADYWEIQSNVIWPTHYKQMVTNGFTVRRYRTERF